MSRLTFCFYAWESNKDGYITPEGSGERVLTAVPLHLICSGTERKRRRQRRGEGRKSGGEFKWREK